MRSSEAGTCRAAIAPPHVLSCAAYLLRAEMPTYNNNRSSHCYCASSRYGSSYAPWSPSSCYYYSWHSSLSFANNFFAVLTILTSSFSSPSQRRQQQPAAAPATLQAHLQHCPVTLIQRLRVRALICFHRLLHGVLDRESQRDVAAAEEGRLQDSGLTDPTLHIFGAGDVCHHCAMVAVRRKGSVQSAGVSS